MKIWKTLLIIGISIAIILISLRLIGLKSYKIPTSSMENTIPRGSRIIVLIKKFIPERFEIITYRNPEFDTVISPYNGVSYYVMMRQLGKENFDKQYDKHYVPLKDREVWVGRCVGIPGDKVKIENSKLYVNDKLFENQEIKRNYTIKTKDNVAFSPNTLAKLGIEIQEMIKLPDRTILNLTNEQYEKIIKFPVVDSISKVIEKNKYNPQIFPFNSNFIWSPDNFGELIIPQKGIEIQLNKINISLYERLIRVYEQNELTINDGNILINGKLATSYIPKMDYYLIICDNRDNSADSRFWGFLPENHIYGKVLKIVK